MSRGFLSMQTSNKICHYKKSRSSLFILDNEHVNGKLLVKVFIVTIFGSNIRSPCNNEVKLVKMSRLLIRALSTRACVFISRAFAAGDSYKDTKSGNEKRRNG